jgi:hypothetical protein
MTRMGTRVTLTVTVALLVACAVPSTPTGPTTAANWAQTTVADIAADRAVGELAAWIVHPPDLPPGRVGKNNCTFPFGQVVPQWDFHADAGCWEHRGPDGWTRQQYKRIHIPSSPLCGGGPGDGIAIRVCRVGGRGQPSPCLIDASTGQNGCARCVATTVCH